MHTYGRAALAAGDAGALPLLARLYWYTVEFGPIHDAASPDGVKIYGAGIVSSTGETLYSQQSAAPNRIGFDLERVMQTRYRIDTFQKTYFVIENFMQLFEVARTDFAPLLAKLADSPTHRHTGLRRRRHPRHRPHHHTRHPGRLGSGRRRLTPAHLSLRPAIEAPASGTWASVKK